MIEKGKEGVGASWTGGGSGSSSTLVAMLKHGKVVCPSGWIVMSNVSDPANWEMKPIGEISSVTINYDDDSPTPSTEDTGDVTPEPTPKPNPFYPKSREW